MDDNLFQNYTKNKLLANDLSQYAISDPYLENKYKIDMPKNNRYSNYNNRKSYTTNLKINEKPNQYISKNYEKKFLYNSFNNINNNDNYEININNKKKILSKSIRQNEDNYSLNPQKFNLYNKYIKMNNKQNRNNSNQAFYSSADLLSKNIQNQLKKIDEKIINANMNNLNLGNNPETENFNTNNKDKELFLDKNEFFGKIKEINDLEYLDIESQEVLNNFVLNNNNIYINENKNIF